MDENVIIGGGVRNVFMALLCRGMRLETSKRDSMKDVSGKGYGYGYCYGYGYGYSTNII